MKKALFRLVMIVLLVLTACAPKPETDASISEEPGAVVPLAGICTEPVG